MDDKHHDANERKDEPGFFDEGKFSFTSAIIYSFLSFMGLSLTLRVFGVSDDTFYKILNLYILVVFGGLFILLLKYRRQDTFSCIGVIILLMLFFSFFMPTAKSILIYLFYGNPLTRGEGVGL
jgi:hypothetical protein